MAVDARINDICELTRNGELPMDHVISGIKCTVQVLGIRFQVLLVLNLSNFSSEATHDLLRPTGTKVVIMQMPAASEADAPAVLRVVPLFGGEAVTWISWISIQWLSSTEKIHMKQTPTG